MEKDSQLLTLSAGSETYFGDEDVESRTTKAARADLRDMIRMGKRQELSRNFGFLSILGILSLAMGSWGAQISNDPTGLVDGGMANLIWTYILVFFCWCCVVASMAEMASMAPTSGAQYHWVSEFAPPRAAHLLSYIVGWSSTFAWQMAFFGNIAGLSYFFQDLLALNGTIFTFNAWQTNLMLIATAALSVAFNANIGNSLALWGGAMALLYFCLFFANIIPLLVLSPRTDVQTVFLSFSNPGDPGGLARTLIFGIFNPIISFMAPDVAAHMSEEVRNSSITVPRAMMTSIVLNGILGFLALITFCFTVGDINAVISSGVSARISIFFNATNSTTGTMSLSIIAQIIGLAGSFINLTSASRLLYAFARDKGVPYASFLSRVRPGWKVPLNAIMFTFCFSVVLSLISIATTQVANLLYSIAVSGNFFSYIISIGCVRLKRWRKEPLPYHCWNLGRWGAPVNDVALIFLIIAFVLLFVPQDVGSAPITADNMNWAAVVFGVTILFSLVFYYIKGRHVYVNPASLVRKDV